MEANKRTTTMEKVAAFIVDRRNIIFLLFIMAALFCAYASGWVKVNDSLTDYLPEDTETQIGLELMDKEFVTYGTAHIMVENITYEQAEMLLDRIEKTAGVKSVAFEDNDDHYADSAALYVVTFDGTNDDQVSIDSLKAVRAGLDGYDVYVDSEVGNPLKIIINQEMIVVDIIAVIIIIVVLLFTSKTYAEIPVLLLTFGAAALLNMGTNYMVGEISFVTDSIAIVLQLALAIDYAVILCHRYMEEHEALPPREAAIVALSKAIPEISASSLTTVSGLLALSFMEYKLGFDIAIVLIKAILLSLVSVFLLMPGLLVMFSGLIDKSHHKSFVPKIPFLGRFAFATRFVMPAVFIVVIVAAFFFSNNANYVYDQASVNSVRQNESQIAIKKIKECFGEKNQLAIIVPTGDYEKEANIINDLNRLERTVSVTGLACTEALDDYYLTSKLTPREFAELTDLDYDVAKTLYAAYALNQEDYGQIITNLDNYKVPLIDMFEYLCDEREDYTLNLTQKTVDDLDEIEEKLDDGKKQLMSPDWSRIIIELDLTTESQESFEYLNVIHNIAAQYYDTYYVVGNTTSCSDLKTSFEKDNIMISVLTIVFVIVVLLFSFKSAGLPVLQILIIQGSIWINFSMPHLLGDNLFFLTYLIISSIQMGANIDYAIVISSRYMNLKKTMPLKEAMIESLNQAFPTIITSGTMLASAGIVIGLMTSNETISTIGVYLGVGTSISILLVLCVLPQMLLLGDILISKTSFSLNSGVISVQEVGVLSLNGRVHGYLNGRIDAEVHGVFRGELNAMVDMRRSEEPPDRPADMGGTGEKQELIHDGSANESADSENSENNEGGDGE